MAHDQPAQYLLRGQDRLMITPLELRITNSIVCEIVVDEGNRESSVYKTIVRRIERALRDERHYLRARQNLHDLGYYYYDTEASSSLARKIVRTTHHKHLTFLELGEVLVRSGMSGIVRIHKNKVMICMTHQFIDGLKVADLIGLCLDAPIIDWAVIPAFRYTPVVTEATVLPGLIGTLMALSPRQLSVDSDWRREFHPIQSRYYVNRLCDVKRLKAHLNTRHPRFGFSATVAVIATINAFENTTKSAMNVGIIASFRNDARFNNFTAMIVQVTRPPDWHVRTLIDKVHHFAAQIDSAVGTYGKASTIINYLVTNVYNVDWYTNDMVDVLVSCAPTPLRCTFQGKDARLTSMTMYGTTVPLYIGFWSNNEHCLCNIISRSRDYDYAHVDTLQLREMMRHID